MAKFADTYADYVREASSVNGRFGFDLATVEKIEPLLSFLFHSWWRVDLKGLDFLPEAGPALIACNAGGGLAWPPLMLMYALMANKKQPRKLNVLADIDWIDDERVYRFLVDIGFVPWSSANAKALFDKGQLVAVCPEIQAGMTRPFSERHRLRELDWTKMLPAVESKVPVYPLTTLGCDEAVPVLGNFERLARLLNLPAYPVTPFFPWLPFPISLISSLPVAWHMRLLKPTHHEIAKKNTDSKAVARKLSSLVEGEIQAELNRLLRTRIKSF